MITSRGFWLLAILAAILAAATAFRAIHLILLTLVFLAWYFFEACLFAYRASRMHRWLRLARTIDEQPPSRVSIWADRPVKVRVVLYCRSQLGFAMLDVSERRPTLGACSGKLEAFGPCNRSTALSIEYEYRSSSPGRARFDGLAIKATDAQGLFRHEFFLRHPAEIVVLPGMAPTKVRSGTTKRLNILIAQGIHRLRRPGSGSELLDLREYMPGDPPKTIAWKVSARRDRLITREYESEVPVRCTIFLDHGDSVRLVSNGRSAFKQLAMIAISLAQRLVSVRDPVGLCLFDGAGATQLPPAPGQRQVVRMTTMLSKAANEPPRPSECPPDRLIDPLRDLCQSVYPDLLDRKRNRLPFGFRWPLAGMPWLSHLVVLVLLLCVRFLVFVPLMRDSDMPDWQRLLLGLAWLISVLYIGTLFVARLIRRTAVKGDHTKRQTRKQLSAVLTVRDGLGPGGIELLANDDRAFSLAAQRLLIEHQVDYPRPLHGNDGRYLFAEPEKIAVLAKRLLRTVAHGRDNELFVLLVDLFEVVDQCTPLFDAIKVAVARHHQVVVICPWPAELELPAKDSSADQKTDDEFAWLNATRMVVRIDESHFHRALVTLRGRLARIGVPLIVASAQEAVQQIINRVERLRAARTSPAGRIRGG